MACSVQAKLLAWHFRPPLPDPSSCSFQHLYSVPSSCFPHWVQNMPSCPISLPLLSCCPYLKPRSSFLPSIQILIIPKHSNSTSSISPLLVPLSPELLEQGFSNLNMHQNNRGGLLQHRLLAPTPRVFDSIGLGGV